MTCDNSSGGRAYTDEILRARNRVFREFREGEEADAAIVRAVSERSPGNVLEVGCGFGELAERLTRELSADVVATDVAPLMVELTASRGVNAQQADVHRLPFASSSFDVVVAGWMLFHTELDRALGEIVRVLRPGGRLVATTYADGNFRELWRLVGDEIGNPPLSFGDGNGEEVLRRFFAHVERRNLEVWAVFPDAPAAREFIAATRTRSHLAPQMSELAAPLRVSNHQVIFVAETAARNGPQAAALGGRST